ncbi:hypothetical protein MUA04_04690 [Enterobacteriaceae bacterium H11S18]|uniref:tail fiber/spike domain-containing protein n=1 Tax=Dryocola clanedunensis TaxID=2925396 RepID=UPI0022F08E93|nr:hypothetical protein [Dryocola clanedunensis]MCT4709487.1 hypothetical protein [Dryocola clanedunensis]
MATTPTQNAVPSELPQDLKFNAGKIDEFVTSVAQQYIDRFGNAHYTIEGLKQLALQQIYNLGWNPVGTFQDGVTVSSPGDIAQDESTGIWYRWDDLGSLPKVVPGGSTPDSTGGVGDGKWQPVDVSDVLRKDLSKPSGAELIGYQDTTVKGYLDYHTGKTTINLNAFGSTGTQTNGSNEAWDAAFAYALTIVPLYVNQIGQEWYDFSGLEFRADGPVYPKTPIKFRTTYGLSLTFNIILPDDFLGEYAIDASADAGIIPNRRPLYTKIYSNINCRYVSSGVFVNDFLHFCIFGAISNYLHFGVITGTSGNEFMMMPGSSVMQRMWSSDGDASFPAKVTDGIGVYINSADAKVLGCVIAYYKTRGLHINAPSCFVGSASHIYAAGRQSVYQSSSGSNLNINHCWLDSARVQLEAGYANISNCSIYLTQSSDSNIGILCGSNASNINVFDNSFIGNTLDTTPVYYNKGVYGDKTIAVYKNRYASGMFNADVVDRSSNIILRGAGAAGVATLDPSCYCRCRYDGQALSFEMLVRWSGFSGGTGILEVYGLPFSASTITPFSTAQSGNNATFAGATANKFTTGSAIRFLKPTGDNVMATEGGASAGYLFISGQYSPS